MKQVTSVIRQDQDSYRHRMLRSFKAQWELKKFYGYTRSCQTVSDRIGQLSKKVIGLCGGFKEVFVTELSAGRVGSRFL